MNTKQEAPVSAGDVIGKLCYDPNNDKISPIDRETFYKKVKETGEHYLPTNYDCFVAGIRYVTHPVSVQVEGLREALYDVLYMCKRTSFTEHTIPKIMNICEAALSSPSGQEKDAVGETVSMEEYNHAIDEIGQLQEQLKEAEDEIRDLQKGHEH